MKKVLLYPLLILSLILSFGASPLPAQGKADSGYTFLLDGKSLIFSVPPQLINGTMMVPLRTIAEAMGAKVTWNQDIHSVVAVKDDVRLQLTINSTAAMRNQNAFKL